MVQSWWYKIFRDGISKGSFGKGETHSSQVVNSPEYAKEYTDHKVSNMSFKLGEQVLWKVSSMKGVL